MARGAALAAAAVLVSLLGHVAGGGALAPSAPLALGGALLGALCVAAADARRSLPAVLATVLAAQPVLHLLAGLGGTHAHTAHPHAQVDVLAMATGHVAAAVVASVLLAEGDRVLFALDALAARCVLGALLPGPAPAAAQASPPVSTPAELVSRLWADAVGRRGPPAVPAS